MNDDQGSTWQFNPAIAADKNGNFIIIWDDHMLEPKNIFAQCFSDDGVTDGDNIKINDDANQARQDYPSSFMDKNGNLIVTWTDSRFFNTDIFAQKFTAHSIIPIHLMLQQFLVINCQLIVLLN